MISKIWALLNEIITNATRSRICRGVPEYEVPKMPLRTPPCYLQYIKQMTSAKFLFIVSCTSFALYCFWVQLAIRPDQSAVTESLIQEALQNVGRDYRYKDVYRKAEKLPKDYKYILLWTSREYAPFYYFGQGQRAFLQNNCSVIKCYVTTNRNFFGGDLTKFDAIAFNGRNLNPSDLPGVRSQHQKYIFFDMESGDNYPICEPRFERFFNWTSTYRLDSDIPSPYIIIRDKKGEIVGPKRKMRWKEDMAVVGTDFYDRIENKTKAAAWFVSHCKARSGRQEYVNALNKALDPYGYTVDIYGKCGSLQCPRYNPSVCNELLKRDYFFYMSMENSFDEDYVTEKLLTALQHDVVPVVYGGADYSRFLPPGSYIDGRKYDVKQLAAMMDKLIHSTREYSKFFRWKPYYTFQNPSDVENVCAVCEALHDKERLQKTTIYEDFRRWWNPHYVNRCPRHLLNIL